MSKIINARAVRKITVEDGVACISYENGDFTVVSFDQDRIAEVLENNLGKIAKTEIELSQ